MKESDHKHKGIRPPDGVGLASYAKPVLKKAEGVLKACLETCPGADGFDFIAKRRVFPSFSRVVFSKALNRSVIGSMNDLVLQAKSFLEHWELSPYDLSLRLNETPLKYLDYLNPKEAFCKLTPGPE